jgi:polysaccharide export outer membrane protein
MISFFLLAATGVNSLLSASGQQEKKSPDMTQVEMRNKLPMSPPIDYVIGPGDLLSIRVFQQPDLSGDVRVTVQGYIRLMFIDEPIQATGHTEWELTDIVQKKLGAILRDPQVSVQVKEAQQDVAYILGAVQSPRPVTVHADTRLLNMMAAGGGLTDRAGNVVHILRGTVWSGEGQPPVNGTDEVKLSSVLEIVNIREMLQGGIELNKRIFAGDVVIVPEADKVFVGGNVNTPGAIELRGDLTLSQALTLAGGVKPASKKNLTIVRQGAAKSNVTEIVVNLGDVQKDPSKDPRLQANDIIYVQSSAVRNLGMSLLTTMAVQMAVVLPFYFINRNR